MTTWDYDKAQVRDSVFEVNVERDRQEAKWGQQNHPNGDVRPSDDNKRAALYAKARCQKNTPEQDNWRDIMDEEITEAYECSNDADLRKELVQVAAVAVAWIEAIDRRAK